MQKRKQEDPLKRGDPKRKSRDRVVLIIKKTKTRPQRLAFSWPEGGRKHGERE